MSFEHHADESPRVVDQNHPADLFARAAERSADSRDERPRVRAMLPWVRSCGDDLHRLDQEVGAVPSIYAIARGCRRVMCPKCGPQTQADQRRWIHHLVDDQAVRILATFTADILGTTTGAGFESQEAAYEYVTEKRLIPKLMEALGVKRWVCVLEFQESGSPHWHVIIDRWVDVARAWHLWRDVWKVGGLDLDAEKGGDGALAGYLAGYIGKASKNLPDWAKNRKRLRFVSCARSLIGFELYREGVLRNKWDDPNKPASVKPCRAAPTSQTIGAGLLACGNKTVLMQEWRDSDGNRCRRFLREVDLPLRAVAEWAHRAGRFVRTEYAYRVEGWEQDKSTGKWHPQSLIVCGRRGIHLSSVQGLASSGGGPRRRESRAAGMTATAGGTVAAAVQQTFGFRSSPSAVGKRDWSSPLRSRSSSSPSAVATGGIEGASSLSRDRESDSPFASGFGRR